MMSCHGRCSGRPAVEIAAEQHLFCIGFKESKAHVDCLNRCRRRSFLGHCYFLLRLWRLRQDGCRPNSRQRRQRLQGYHCLSGRLFSRRCWCWRFWSIRTRCHCFLEPFLLFVEVFSDKIDRVHLLHRRSWTQRFFCFLNCLLRHCFLFPCFAGLAELQAALMVKLKAKVSHGGERKSIPAKLASTKPWVAGQRSPSPVPPQQSGVLYAHNPWVCRR